MQMKQFAISKREGDEEGFQSSTQMLPEEQEIRHGFQEMFQEVGCKKLGKTEREKDDYIWKQ